MGDRRGLIGSTMSSGEGEDEMECEGCMREKRKEGFSRRMGRTWLSVGLKASGDVTERTWDLCVIEIKASRTVLGEMKFNAQRAGRGRSIRGLTMEEPARLGEHWARCWRFRCERGLDLWSFDYDWVIR